MSRKVLLGPARMDVLQGLTGFILVLFVWAHMFFESSILLGKEAMYRVARMFEGEYLFGQPYPLLVSGVAAIIFLLIVLHAILALRKFPGSYHQYHQLHRHIGALRHADTTLWYVQVITGFVMLFLIPAHLFVVFVQPENIGPYASADRVWTGRFWILYALLLIAVHLHAGLGLYRLVVKWGLPVTGNTRALRHRLKMVMWCLVGFFMCLATVTLVTYMVIGYQHSDHAGERYVPGITAEQQEDG